LKTFFVYILASRRRVLYVGVTNNLARRLEEHRAGKIASFTFRYRAREKEIKNWRRETKLSLIAAMNPGFNDLSLEWQLV
jgi:putative endonuclease